MTLAVLALAGGVLAHLCRAGMLASLDVARESRALQERWTMLSCQSTLGDRIPAALARAAAGGSARTSAGGIVQTSAAYDLTVGGDRLLLVFADEQAKINVNALYRARGRAQTEKFISDALNQCGAGMRVRLRPIHHAGEHSVAESAAPAFASPGQLFEDATGQGFASQMAAMRQITCWGNGRLNYRQASVMAIAALVGNDPGAMKAILARRAGPQPVALALDPLAAKSQAGKNLDALFTDTSTCYSLWILATHGAVEHARLIVNEVGDDGHIRTTCLIQ